MVFDSLKNAPMYYSLGPGVEKALKYFESYDVNDGGTDRVYLEGEDIFVNRPAYTTKPPDNPMFEAHRDYIDIMYVVKGEERFYVTPVEDVKIAKEYDPAIEACLGEFDESAPSFRFRAGYFCIFFPQDAHCPGQMWEKPSDVHKLIAKVKMSTL